MPQRLHHFHDEPLSHPNSVPLYELSGLARQHVKVVLTGEGADESFGGYPRYHVARLRGAYQLPPKSAGRGNDSQAPGHRAEKAASLLPLRSKIHLAQLGVRRSGARCSTHRVRRVSGVRRRRSLIAETFDERDVVASMTRYELLTYLQCALDRMDRMSMAQGSRVGCPSSTSRSSVRASIAIRLKLGLDPTSEC